MPRRPQDMRTHDRSLGNFLLYLGIRRSSRSLSQSPFRRAVVLGLHRAKQSNDFTRFFERRFHQVLVEETLIRDLSRG